MGCFSTLIEELRRAAPSLELRQGESMARHTSFRVGGPARLMALPKSELEAEAAVRTAAALDIVPLYMGNGTNLLVSDDGLDTFVIKAFDGLDRLERIGERELTVGSGVLLSRLAHFALECGLTGLEFAHGIPGSVGGAVTMNAGAYGGEICQAIAATVCLTPGGERETVTGAEHGFTYRHSTFSGGERMILGAVFSLTPGDPGEIKTRMDDLAEKRRSKQPLEYPSAGSTFKRPEGHFAAALIEQCGLKGVGIGGAQVSEKHAGFLINRGGASCDDVRRLMDLVRERVRRETGVELEPEVRLLGC